MIKLLLAVVFLLAPTLSHAQKKLDQGLYCAMTSTQFFFPLIQNDVINRKPYKVEDSINYFRPVGLIGLTAFGMHVQAVFGWAEGQMIFVRGPGTAPPEIYGALVNESIGNVQATLNSVGVTKAKLTRIDRSTTAITCYGE